MSTSLTSSSTPLRIGKVTLVVQDLPRVSAFYQQVLGLERLDGSATTALLGTGGTVLLQLEEDRSATISSRGDAGLFHTAFLLPARADLGRWIEHAAQGGVRIQGASDHLVSEALYLADPEGNGIEIYVDRPHSEWPYKDGALQMATDPLDIDRLRAEASGTQWQGAPAGTVIGHVHLQVGALSDSDAFYAGVLGLEVTTRYPGASFYGSGGYHHHLAGNIWNSRNAGKRSSGSTGLRTVEILAANKAAFEAVVAKAASAGINPDAEGGQIRLADSWNTELVVRQAERA
jgi:catechol 2,3-dioxygenase